MKKFAAILLALVLALGCLTGCGSKKGDTVMSVEGTDVSFDEFMYYLKTAATTLTKYYQSSTGGGVDWDGVCIYDKTKTNAEWCVNEALYNAAQACVIMSKGKSMNCLPTDEQLKTLEDNISAIRKIMRIRTTPTLRSPQHSTVRASRSIRSRPSTRSTSPFPTSSLRSTAKTARRSVTRSSRATSMKTAS